MVEILFPEIYFPLKKRNQKEENRSKNSYCNKKGYSSLLLDLKKTFFLRIHFLLSFGDWASIQSTEELENKMILVIKILLLAMLTMTPLKVKSDLVISLLDVD